MQRVSVSVASLSFFLRLLFLRLSRQPEKSKYEEERAECLLADGGYANDYRKEGGGVRFLCGKAWMSCARHPDTMHASCLIGSSGCMWVVSPCCLDCVERR